MHTIPLTFGFARNQILDVADYIENHSAPRTKVRISLFDKESISSDIPGVFGTTIPALKRKPYRINIACGPLGAPIPPSEPLSQDELKTHLLSTLETLYHENRHVQQFCAMSRRTIRPIPGLEYMATEWLATCDNPAFYRSVYPTLTFELDAIAEGFDKTYEYWQDNLQPYITEQELFDQMADRCRAHSFPVDQMKPGSIDELINNIRAVCGYTPVTNTTRHDIATIDVSEDDFFFGNLARNSQAKPIAKLWDNCELSNDQRLKLLAEFSFHSDKDLRNIAKVVSAEDFPDYDFDMRRCANACIFYALFHPEIKCHSASMQASDNTETDIEEVQEAVDTMMPSGAAEDIGLTFD